MFRTQFTIVPPTRRPIELADALVTAGSLQMTPPVAPPFGSESWGDPVPASGSSVPSQLPTEKEAPRRATGENTHAPARPGAPHKIKPTRSGLVLLYQRRGGSQFVSPLLGWA